MAPTAPAGEVTVRVPGWVMGYVRGGSLLGMVFGLISLLLMMSGAPKYPVYWPTVWTAIGLTLFAGGVFIAAIMPMTDAQGGVSADAHGAATNAATALARADDSHAEATGDDEMYTGPDSVVDTEKRVTTAPGNDLEGDALSGATQRRALAASARERRANNTGNGGGNGGANTTTLNRRPLRP